MRGRQASGVDWSGDVEHAAGENVDADVSCAE